MNSTANGTTPYRQINNLLDALISSQTLKPHVRSKPAAVRTQPGGKPPTPGVASLATPASARPLVRTREALILDRGSMSGRRTRRIRLCIEFLDCCAIVAEAKVKLMPDQVAAGVLS